VKINRWIYILFIIGIIFISGCAIPGQPPIVFTHHITDLSKIMYVVPPGSQSGNTFAEHSYIRINEDVTELAVYAPIDSELYSVGYYIERESDYDASADDTPYFQYILFFKVNENVFYYFDHFADVSQKIKNVSPQQPSDQSTTDDPTSPTYVKGGELIGYVYRDIGGGGYDFGVYDLTNRNKVANHERLSGYIYLRRYLTGLCPYDFYPEDMKREYLDLFSGPGGTPVIVSECRGLSRDVIGTAAGYWFLDSGSDETYGPQLVIASTLAGNVRWGGVGPFTTNHASKSTDPAKVVVGQSTCYFDIYSDTNYLFIELLSETELAAFYGEGKCPSAFPEEGYKVYFR